MAETIAHRNAEATHNIGQKHYFSPDGNYGSANDLMVIDTTNWTDKDWERIEECNDNDRLDIASIINSQHSD